MASTLASLERELDKLCHAVRAAETLKFYGYITRVRGLVVESRGPRAKLGELCYIERGPSQSAIPSEVVGFDGERVLLMPYGNLAGVEPGARVVASGRFFTVPVGREMLSRVVDGLGRPIDGRGPIPAEDRYPAEANAPGPLERRRITDPLALGVRSIDGLLTCGKGQRIGIFSGSGVGKSTLLGMMARNTEADVSVVALVGERGREVREFIQKDLGEEGLRRSVVVVATSDNPALVRIKAAHVATAIAEFFRDQGFDVALFMDSVTRYAMALREVGLAVGEPPTARGYTPSVFAALPRLLERAGMAGKGSITGFYTVLVEGDDFAEPISDSLRALLDGHIMLDRRLANRGLYPAVDVLSSQSRVMLDVTSAEHQKAAATFRKLLATYEEAEDLINIGAYAKGTNPEIDAAMEAVGEMRAFLAQGIHEKSEFADTIAALVRLTSRYR